MATKLNKMKVGDLVQFKKSFISKSGVQKRGLVLEVGHRDTNAGIKSCVRCLWDHPGAGIRWAQARWLEVISEGR